MTTVTLVTTCAQSADDLTDADYRDIYDELRVKCSLDTFVVTIGSAVSKAWWSKYERGEATLTRSRRAELRAAVGLPPLPPAVADALANVDPDASVYQVGGQRASRVVLVGADVSAVNLRLNGACTVEPHVTGVTTQTFAETAESAHRTRVRYFRPCLSFDLEQRVGQLEVLLAEARSAIDAVAAR